MSENNLFRYSFIPAAAILSVLLFVRPALAYDAQYVNKESGYEAYIIDEEDLLTDEEEEELLYDYMKPITEYGGVSFVTTSSGNAEKAAAEFSARMEEGSARTARIRGLQLSCLRLLL